MNFNLKLKLKGASEGEKYTIKERNVPVKIEAVTQSWKYES